jgi:GTP-binding protein EngB required for normal cell division
MRDVFIQHMRAAFQTGGKQIPRWLLASQLSAQQQIERAGMSDQLAFILNGFKAGQERVDEPFEVFIVGEGKHGKSTLINALVGCNIAPTDRLPKTWCFNRYIASPVPNANVRLFVQGDLSAYPHLSRLLGSKLRETRGLSEYCVSRSAAEQIVKGEEAKWTQCNDRTYVSPIMEIEWQVSSGKALLPGLRLVDTQGIGQIHSDYEHRHYLKWQYERADAVLWLLAQDKIGATTTDREIDEARRYAKPVILVLNKWDEIHGNPERQLEMAQFLYGKRVNAIVPFSAIEAFLAVEPRDYCYSNADYKRLKKHCCQMWSDLRGPSGLDHLVKVFEEMIWNKASLVRNAQIYSSTRRKQVEYRNVMSRRKTEIKNNIKQYRSVLTSINVADQDNRDRVNTSFQTVKNEAFNTIETHSAQIVWGNKHWATSLLQLEVISSFILQAQRNVAQQCTYRFADVVAEAQRDRSYHDSEAAPDGSIAMVQQILSMSDPDVTVMPIETPWKVDVPSSLWDDLSRGVRWILGHFSDEARKSLEQEDEEIRRRIKQMCLEQLESHIENAISSFDAPLDQVVSRMKNDLNNNINSLGGMQYLEAAIPEIENALVQIAVPSVFIAVPTEIMRHLDWPLTRADHAIRR